ncbi:hypothetical protein GCK32_016662 [Trichostrongylus colubriformis]|uniref:Uncharacterized protein n=1 Tax=Trichostrongylus colubriformis TaxID=6319 RepID=A0AAN8EXK5_TRICO
MEKQEVPTLLPQRVIINSPAIAYSRNEGEIKLAPSSPKEDAIDLDKLAWVVHGFTIDELQTMITRGDVTEFLVNMSRWTNSRRRFSITPMYQKRSEITPYLFPLTS